MCHLCPLQLLGLRDNKIGDAGLIALASACDLVDGEVEVGQLCYRATGTRRGALAHLRELSLGGNTISEKTKGTMRAVMSKSGGAVYL